MAKRNLNALVYTAIIIEAAIVIIGVSYFYQNYSFNYPLLLNAAIGLLTFTGIFYALLLPGNVSFIDNFKKMLNVDEKTMKDKLIKDIKNKANIIEVLDKYRQEFQQLNINKKLINLNVLLSVSVFAYTIVIIQSLFLKEGSNMTSITFVIFMIGVTSTMFIVTVWFLLSLFEREIEEKIDKAIKPPKKKE